MRVAIGCDHRGLALKQTIINLIAVQGHNYEDFGTYDTRPMDYPDVAKRVADAVVSGRFDCGILSCGTGIGMSIAANKVKGIRAALCHDTFSARMARQHNAANVLCLGSWVVGPGLAEEIVKTYLSATFEGGRHQKRLEKIQDMEKER
jgi:ribose 5-phosphate isomerase B